MQHSDKLARYYMTHDCNKIMTPTQKNDFIALCNRLCRALDRSFTSSIIDTNGARQTSGTADWITTLGRLASRRCGHAAANALRGHVSVKFPGVCRGQ